MSEKNALPKEILVKRTRPNIVTIVLKGDKQVRIFPGINRIKDEEIIGLLHNDKFNHGWKGQLQSGALSLISGDSIETPEKETTEFTAMTASQAINVVKETLSIPALEQMSIDEQGRKDRKTVQDAIADQIKYLKSDDAGK